MEEGGWWVCVAKLVLDVGGDGVVVGELDSASGEEGGVWEGEW